MNLRRLALLLLLLLCGACGPGVDSGSGSTAAPVYKFVDKLVDSSDNRYDYAYAPTILYDGAFHMFYCSSGSNGGWDDIRYVSSPDGRLWTEPQIVLTTTDLVNERATCDPSIVRYQAPGDAAPYYYLFYSGNKHDVQTVMFVARSATIAGPYAKWTTAGTWVVNAPNPKILLGPAVPKADGPGWYGAGQQTVVVRDGKLVSWYSDDTVCAAGPCLRLFKSTTTNPTSWPVGTATNVTGVGSVDVKFDPSTGKYMMFSIEDGHQPSSSLARRSSTDGITWGPPEVLAAASDFPDWANNPGVSGDPQGHLIDGRALIVYGAPYDLDPGYNNDCMISPAPHCWAHWDLYGSVLNPHGQVWNEIPWGWSWAGMGTQHRLALGDYDGDGKTDRAIYDSNTFQWYVIGSSGASPVPWGWSWAGMGPQHRVALGDYDGDGKTDRAIVDPAAGNWYVIGSSGASPVPWGWHWAGMGPQHQLALGDYDGDGKTDRAIVDPAAGDWYVIGSSGASPVPWGWHWAGMGSQHRLALGNYDGDGKTDRAIYDSTTFQWYVIGSSGASPVPWGWPWAGMTVQHKLALGDYDGDGKTDRAIVDPLSGNWYVIGSSGASPIPWGWHWTGMTVQHKLALGDYDGDGKTDRAIVDPITGRWYVIGSAPFAVY